MEPIRSEYEDDPDMLEIVQEFVAELPDRVVAMEECFASSDFSRLQTFSHQLKGAGGGYGFPIITDQAAALESALKESAESGMIKDRLAALCEVLHAVVVPEAD